MLSKSIELSKEQFILTNNDPISLTVNQSTEFSIITQPNIQGSIVLKFEGSSKEVQLAMHIKKDSSLTILCLNESNGSFVIHENIVVDTNANLKIAYGEFHSAKVQRNAQYELKSGAGIQIVSAIVASSEKQFNLICTHTQPNSTSEMNNYGIVLDEGKLCIEATGKIVKGAYLSKSHQTTRVLTNADKQKATVLPQLLIDENDVEASHATSIGQLDENQLYYMQSRGLSRSMAMQLIAIGYLMPITNIIEDEELKQYLETQIVEKVNQTCFK